MALAAEAPDLDMLGNFKGPVFGFAHHRGFTHSFLGLFLVSALVVGFMYLIWRLRGRKTNNPNLPPRWALLFLYAYLAGLTHILLDFTNGYGVRPFWPFSEKWYSWDIVFIADPILLLFLVAGLLVPIFFSLVDRELGVRQKAPAGRIGATLALLGVLGVWGVRDYQHRRAVNALKAYVYDKAEPIRASAYPNWWNPFSWNGVVETQNFYATTLVDSLQPEVDPNAEMQILYKPQETPVTLCSQKLPTGPRLSGLGSLSHYRDRAHRNPAAGIHRALYGSPVFILAVLLRKENSLRGSGTGQQFTCCGTNLWRPSPSHTLMKISYASHIACWLLLTAAGLAQASPDPVDQYIQAEMTKRQIPGLSLLVVRDGKTVRAQGYGFSNVELQVPVKPETVFQSGSMGKQFTATAVMMLVEEEKIHLDDPLTKYFTDAPPAWNQVTVRQLLSHTAGFTDYPKNFNFRRDRTEAEMLKIVEGVPLAYPPGTKFDYSNLGYLTLGSAHSSCHRRVLRRFLAGTYLPSAGNDDDPNH